VAVAVEWLTMTADALLAQSAIDRLTSNAHTLVIEGPSYRQRNRPNHRLDANTDELEFRTYAAVAAQASS